MTSNDYDILERAAAIMESYKMEIYNELCDKHNTTPEKSKTPIEGDTLRSYAAVAAQAMVNLTLARSKKAKKHANNFFCSFADLEDAEVDEILAALDKPGARRCQQKNVQKK